MKVSMENSVLEKLRKPKIFGLALFDLIFGIIGTVILFLILRRIHFSTLDRKNFIIAAILLTIPLGIFTHVLFGTDTTLNSRLGLSYKP